MTTNTLPSGERRTLMGQVASRDRSWDGWGMAGWLPNPDPVLKATGRDISTYRDMRADAHVGGCIRRRKAAVRALEQRLEREGAPARVQRAIEGMLVDLWATPDADEPGARPGLPALIGEALDGALYGYQPLEITWGRAGSLLVPTVVQGKPPEWFHFDAQNQLRFKAREAGADGERLPARKFLLARQEPTYQNPYGVPDLAMVFWPYTFRRAAKFWVAWLERYGGDFLLGKLPRSASVQEYTDLTERLEAMIQDAVAAIPDDGSVEVLASANKGGSTDAHERFLLYWRGEISIALLGTNQGTEQSSTLASASAALEVANDIRDHDARMIEAVLNQLIRWTVALNWPGAAAPRWTLVEQEEIDTALPARDKLLTECGVRFTRDYWMRTYDLEDADLAPEDEPEDEPEAEPEDEPEAEPEPAAALAEPAAPDGQDLIEAAGAQDPGWQAVMEALLAPILAALEEGLAPEDILARLDEWYPRMDDAGLLALLERGIAAAEAIGRLETAAEAASAGAPR
jgi:phage gp29-like protein